MSLVENITDKDSVEGRILKLFRKRDLLIDEAKLDVSIARLGVDSLEAVEIISELEDEFNLRTDELDTFFEGDYSRGHELPEKFYDENLPPTIRQISEYIKSRF